MKQFAMAEWQRGRRSQRRCGQNTVKQIAGPGLGTPISRLAQEVTPRRSGERRSRPVPALQAGDMGDCRRMVMDGYGSSEQVQ
jgi:hypothetical protein